MKNSWRFFSTISILLIILVFWQILHNPPRAAIFLVGMVLLIFSHKRQGTVKRAFLFIGCAFTILSLLYTVAFWALLIFAILFIGLKGVELTGISLINNKNFWKKKNLIIVETKEPESINGHREKIKWFGDDRIGTSVFEWDDINLTVFAGDTIIDLGNTLLPKKDNVIVVRKVFGDTKILVPSGVAIMVKHQALFGELQFEGEEFEIKNEQLTVNSDDYDTNTRRIKIISSGIFGDVEVIRV